MTAATRNNVRDHGHPTTGHWFGRGRTPAGDGTPVTIERHGRGLTVRDLNGDMVDTFGDTAKFWLAPAAAEAPADDRAQADIDAAHVEARHIAGAAHYGSYAPNTPAATPLGTVLRLRALHASLDVDASRAYAAGHRTLGDALTARCAALTVEIAAAVRADAIDSATRTTVTPPPADQQPADQAPTPVVIIPCGARKAAGPVRAAEKYIGPYARSARLAGEALAARTGARILTLSARYGLLTDDDLVADYDLTMGEAGSVTAGRIAEQAAALGITDALVTVIAGKAYADKVTTVWPHAVRALDGCGSFGNQRARMGEIARGAWSPAQPAAATSVPALFGADLVAPPAVETVAAADLVVGDVVDPAGLGLDGPDPIMIAVAAAPSTEPGRVVLAYRSGPGRTEDLSLPEHTPVTVVGQARLPKWFAWSWRHVADGAAPLQLDLFPARPYRVLPPAPVAPAQADARRARSRAVHREATGAEPTAAQVARMLADVEQYVAGAFHPA